MKNAILKYVLWYAIFVTLFVVMKVMFIISNGDIFPTITFGDYVDVIVHGLPMDLATAGYLTVIPALLIIARQWTRWRGLRVITVVYSIVAALIVGCVAIADCVLYGYWEFKLDMTPIFYFTSSPSAALASVGGAYVAWCVVGSLAISFVVWMLFNETVLRIRHKGCDTMRCRWVRTAVLVLMTGVMFLAMRGGVTVSTMNLSSAYYSDNMRLNHAAVNPLFSLIYSATHQNHDSERFHFMDDSVADDIVKSLLSQRGGEDTDSTERILSTPRPDIYIILLESFSGFTMPSLGGDAVAMGVDSIARSGLSFTRHFASGFRTDRAIPAVIGGFPSLPTVGVMKEMAKCEKLPSLAQSLVDEGYDATYYYGGDANFTNMWGYLIAAGFERIVSDKDFPVSQRMSKWGVHDHLVLERAWSDVSQQKSKHPQFVMIQTSSSHEPFEVPYRNPRLGADERANAIAYTDSCVTAFVDRLRTSPRWERSLVVLVADHYGTYPAKVDDNLGRHRVPLVMTGGALLKRGEIDWPVGQTDIAPTLLGMLGLDHGEFVYGRDVLANDGEGAVAFFSNPNVAALVTSQDTTIYDINAATLIAGKTGSNRLTQLKALLQVLYNDFERR